MIFATHDKFYFDYELKTTEAEDMDYGFHEKNPNQIFLKSKQTFCDNKNV